MRLIKLLFICSFIFTQCLAKEGIPANILEVGDLVFRQGIGSESKVIQILSSHPYSHIAMVTQTKPVMLIHATTNDNEKQPNQVILSSLDDFVKHGKKFAVKRFHFSKENKIKIVEFALQDLKKGFTLSPDKDAIYCTTLLENAINKIENLKLDRIYVSFPFFQGHYLFPKAFYEDNKSVVVYESE